MKPTLPVKFSEVFQTELGLIKLRRENAGFHETKDEGTKPSSNLVGLALSGGGIRSATFCLGLLQGLHSRGLLRIFDYLSTVSGGGYVGGWWSAWLFRKANGKQSQVFPDEEKDELTRSDLRLDERRKRHSRGESDAAVEHKPEGAQSAGVDPIHHLRLFANYLTPRRGLMSADTWRAVAVITRNLVMTWLALLPVLVALVLAGQLYFVVHPDPLRNFIFYPYDRPKDQAAQHQQLAEQQWRDKVLTPARNAWLKRRNVDADKVQLQQMKSNWRSEFKLEELRAGRTAWIKTWIAKKTLRERHVDQMKTRLRFALQPLIALAGWIFLMGTLWLLFSFHTKSRSEGPIVVVCLLAVAAVILCLLFSSGEFLQSIRSWLLNAPGWRAAWAIIAAGLVAYALWPAQGSDMLSGDKALKKQWTKEVIRTRITLLHAKLLVLFVVTAVVLGVAGFGHEIIKYPYRPALAAVTKGGGLLAVIAAIVGLIFTGYKATPRGGGDKREVADPSRITRFVFALTPPLVVLVVTFGAAWIGHSVLVFISSQRISNGAPDMVRYLNYGTFFGVAVCLILAMYEMDWQEGQPPLWLYLSLAAPTVPALVVLISLFKISEDLPTVLRNVLNALALAVFAVGVVYICIKILIKRFGNARGRKRPREARKLSVTLSKVSVRKLRVTLSKVSVKGLIGNLLMVGIYAYWFVYVTTGWQAKNATQAGPAGAWFFPISLLIAATFAGGYILYRLAVVSAVNDKTGLDRSFSLLMFKKWAQDSHHRRDALWLLTSACVVLAIAASCGAHSLIAEHQAHPAGMDRAPLEIPNICEYVLVDLLRMDRLQALLVALPVMTLLAAIVIFLCRKSWQMMRRAMPPVGIDLKAHRFAHRVRTEWVDRLQPKSAIMFALLAFACALISINVLQTGFEVLHHTALETRPVQSALTSLTLAGIVLCLAFTRFEMTWGRGENRQSLWLLASAYVALIVLLTISFIPDLAQSPRIEYGYVVFGLIATGLTWVVGLGWMADPNAFSMHGFYRARLVRAYLGASNDNRRVNEKQITEAAAGDDMLLKDLKNWSHGAPYHLISTTLNLVAGRDLAFSQRSAASFTLSPKYCGSLRTGYRPTDKYMNGRLTLGSAVAISGAAASPNMGARTPTSALAMLLTLLNVRLGYWAPTPDRKDWRSPQARLWPFYLMREFASQTNDLSSYCYLTDGGHFENTGLYELIQRGCRFIVVADCGADPSTSFGDLGDAIRRCRIDFGAEIDLDIEHFIKYELERVEKPVRKHFVVGKITYSADHLRRLRGIKEDEALDEKDRDAFVILIKPSFTAKDGADVRQYAIENQDFPQTATTNQFFDEAQFETYRRLGELCGQSAFHGGEGSLIRNYDDIENLFKEAYRSQEAGKKTRNRNRGPVPNRHDNRAR